MKWILGVVAAAALAFLLIRRDSPAPETPPPTEASTVEDSSEAPPSESADPAPADAPTSEDDEDPEAENTATPTPPSVAASPETEAAPELEAPSGAPESLRDDKPESATSLSERDQRLLRRAERRNPEDPWNEAQNGDLIVANPFRGEVTTLTDQRFPIRLKLRRREGANRIVPEWISSSAVPAPKNQPRETNYSAFRSRFEAEEVFIGTLAFPYDAFWRAIVPDQNCQEIALLYERNRVDANARRRIRGRVFCRRTLRDLTAVGDFSGRSSGD